MFDFLIWGSIACQDGKPVGKRAVPGRPEDSTVFGEENTELQVYQLI